MHPKTRDSVCAYRMTAWRRTSARVRGYMYAPVKHRQNLTQAYLCTRGVCCADSGVRITPAHCICCVQIRRGRARTSPSHRRRATRWCVWDGCCRMPRFLDRDSMISDIKRLHLKARCSLFIMFKMKTYLRFAWMTAASLFMPSSILSSGIQE